MFLGIFLFFIWLGFFFPSPSRSAAPFSTEKLIFLWLPRIFIPIFYGVLLFLIFTKRRKLAQNIGVLLVTLSVCVLIVVSVLGISHSGKSSRIFNEKYHPYLQLKPPDPDILNLPDGKKSVKIFCLGGSTTEFKNGKGFGWPDMLEKELRQIYRTDSIFVFNYIDYRSEKMTIILPVGTCAEVAEISVM